MTATVYNIVTDASGRPVANARVVVDAIASSVDDEPLAPWVPSADLALVGSWEIHTGADGRWELDAYLPADLEPDGAHYRVREYVAGRLRNDYRFALVAGDAGEIHAHERIIGPSAAITPPHGHADHETDAINAHGTEIVVTPDEATLGTYRPATSSSVAFFGGNIPVDRAKAQHYAAVNYLHFGAAQTLLQNAWASQNFLDVEAPIPVTAALVGTDTVVYVRYAQTVASAIGNRVQVRAFAGATITDAYGLHVTTLSVGGTLTTAYGIFVVAGAAAGSVGTVYGIYVGAALGAPTVARWGLYQAGAMDPNYFAGELTVAGGMAAGLADGQTGLLVRRNAGGAYSTERVLVGPPGSGPGGVGRALYIAA